VLGLLLPGLVGDGRYGAGWNRVGPDIFLGVQGQGVSGVLTAAGMAADWPGQMTAQLIGAAAIVVWAFSLTWLVLRGLAGIIHAWERSGLEFGAPPAPVPLDEEAVTANIETPTADEAVPPAADRRVDVAVGGSAH
jgi:Amt family ammonium transporter